MEYHESFRAMDTDVDVFIESAEQPPSAVFLSARLLFEQQEERFSRFRDSSLLSRLNRGEVVESPWLARAFAMAIDAFELTNGVFNPMILPALHRAGYDRTFTDVAGGRLEPSRIPDPTRTVRLTDSEVELLAGQADLGGIVKGWTADLAVESLAAECRNVFVNAGGDIRCAGSDSEGPGWAMDVEAPSGKPAWAGRLLGAIATSTSLKRRWTTSTGEPAHHLIDAATGLPSGSPYVQVSARAQACWLAEVWAKAVLIGGPATAARAERYGVPTLCIAADGAITKSENWR